MISKQILVVEDSSRSSGKEIRALLTEGDRFIDTRYGRSFKKNFGSFLFSYVKGSDMKVNHNDRRINSTLGELIAAISEVTFENSADTKEAYTLASLVLVEILKRAYFRSEIVDRHFPMSKYPH